MLDGAVDRSSRPDACPHQMAPAVEARLAEMSRAHPGWRPRTAIRTRLALRPVPPRSLHNRPPPRSTDYP
jgi:hypothetical protein